MEGGKTPLTRLARGKRKRRKKRGAFPTGSGLTPVRPGIKERTNMSELTGCNYDVNEELQQVTDPEQPDDGEFEAWLDSLNERTANGGADRRPHRTRKQLYFATLKANGWTPKPKPPALRPLWQTIQHAWQTIRCARLRSLPLHRRLFCLLFFAPGRYYLAATILGMLVFGSHLSSPPVNVAHATTNPVAKLNPFKHSKVCPTLDGKPFCDLSENDKSLLGKKVKHVKATCTDTGKVDGPEGCQDPSFFVGDGRESLLTETDLDGKLLYPVCHKVYKCKALR